MRLVTYQMLNATELKTGILISKDQVLDIVAEASLRKNTESVATMLDIIRGGEPTMALLRDIASDPKTEPILLNRALLKAPIPRPTTTHVRRRSRRISARWSRNWVRPFRICRWG